MEYPISFKIKSVYFLNIIGLSKIATMIVAYCKEYFDKVISLAPGHYKE
jgi:hypothetical protein